MVKTRCLVLLTYTPGYLNYLCDLVLGWKPEETKNFATQVKKEWNNPDIHGYFMLRVVYGRKPDPSEGGVRSSSEGYPNRVPISHLLS